MLIFLNGLTLCLSFMANLFWNSENRYIEKNKTNLCGPIVTPYTKLHKNAWRGT